MRAAAWALLTLPLSSALTFTPYSTAQLEKGSFFDQFVYDDLASSGWVPSKALRNDGSSYNGQWAIEQAHRYFGAEGRKGLVMKSEAQYYAISKHLSEPFVFGDRDLVLQYEVKFQDGISCGGSYIKLLSEFDSDSFSDSTRYEIMFGPDICGSENRVHFLYHKESSDDEPSKLRTPPMASMRPLSTLYTLIIRTNYDMELRVNGGVAKAGNLVDTPNLMVPPLSVPQKIPDPNATKPEDWDDRPLVFDDSVEKPEDYDELYNTMWIDDPDVKKPEGWNDNESESIPDPDASKPTEWDDEEDGAWEPPMILNPKCKFGCGKWEPPKKLNPNYKGEWMPPAMENPNYKGVWKAPLVNNPEYAASASNGLRPITGIGIDVWSVETGVMFSHIYLGHSIEEAEKIGNETFLPQLELENENYKDTKPKAKHEPRAPPKTFEDFVDEDSAFVEPIKKFFFNEFHRASSLWSHFQIDPLGAITAHPVWFAVYCFSFLVVFTFVFGAINVLFFIFLTSKDNQKQVPQSANSSGTRSTEKEASEDEKTTEAEMIARITGSTGVATGKSRTKKIR